MRPLKLNPTLGFLLHAMLFIIASLVRWSADSYRNFRVGVVALGYNKNVPWWRRWRLFTGANTQKRSGPHPERCCAERKARKKASDTGYVIVIIAVVGPHQQDDHSGLDHGATLPCGHCRDDFDDDLRADGPIKRWTKILGFNPSTFRCVEISVDQFLKGHRRAKRSKGRS